MNHMNDTTNSLAYRTIFNAAVDAYQKQRSTTSRQILETRLDMCLQIARSRGFKVRLQACGGANIVLVPNHTRTQTQTLLYASPAHFVDDIQK